MSDVKISGDEHEQIVSMHLEGKNFYEIAKKVFKFENEETLEAVAQEVASADEAGEFVAEPHETEETVEAEPAKKAPAKK